jgi:hypothetical protein
MTFVVGALGHGQAQFTKVAIEKLLVQNLLGASDGSNGEHTYRDGEYH